MSDQFTGRSSGATPEQFTTGLPYLSDYIYDEVVTLTRTRGGSFEAAKRFGDRLRGVDPYPDTYEMLRVSDAASGDAVNVFERYDDRQLRFTDATSLALCRRHDIDAIMILSAIIT